MVSEMTESIQKTPPLEMNYSTFGNFGQHGAKHPLFVVGNKLLTADEAVEKGIAKVQVFDRHSNKNLYYKREYEVVKKVDAIIQVSCYASSRRHESQIQVLQGDVKIDDWLSDGIKLGWVITVGDKRYTVPSCIRGTKPRIADYDTWLAKRRLWKEAEEKAKNAPYLTIHILGSNLVIKGDTFHHREAIKLAARALGTRATWDPYGKAWVVKGISLNDFLPKLEEQLPSAAKIEVVRQ